MENIGSDLSVLEEIGNLSKEGLIVYNLEESRVQYANASAVELVGLRENDPQKEVVSLLNRLDESELEHLKKHYREVIENLYTRVQIKLPGAHGLDLFVACSAYRVADSSLLVILLRNITPAHQHKEYLLKYTMKKNTLLDTLAHHLSGALNLMQHLSTEAEKYVSTSADDNLKTYLALVQANSKHCLQIIHDLVTTENREAPGIAIRKDRTDLVVQIATIVEELQQSYRGRTIAFYSSSPAVVVSTDQVKVLLILNNLVSNALKFSREQDSILVKLLDNEREAIIQIIDNGIGIPEDLKPYIFERQPTTGRVGLLGEKSSGLGLFIAKNLVSLIGGTIGFESEPGKGSTFYVTIPKR